MKKYILIEVANREINHAVYDSINQASLNLYALFMNVCSKHDLNLDDDYECWISEDCDMAYANGKNCWYDWQIIEVEA